jgi:hypothetical protein
MFRERPDKIVFNNQKPTILSKFIPASHRAKNMNIAIIRTTAYFSSVVNSFIIII